MAFAHPPGLQALRKHRPQRSALRGAPLRQPPQRGAHVGHPLRQQRLQRRQAILHRRHDCLCGAPALFGSGHRRTGMKLRDLLRQGVDVAGQQALLLQQVAQQRLLRKAAHAHRRFRVGRGRFGRLQLQAVCRTGQRHQPQIQGRRGAAVDAQLFLAGAAPQRGGAEVQKIQLQGLLELVDKVACQQQPGDMDFDPLHGAGGVAKSLGAALQLAQALLGGGIGFHQRFRDHGSTLRQGVRNWTRAPSVSAAGGYTTT